MIFSIAISVPLEAILNPPRIRVCNHRQYPWRIGAKFSALRELLVASWNFHNSLLWVVANTLTHTGIGVAAVGRSATFYDAALGALGMRPAQRSPGPDLAWR